MLVCLCGVLLVVCLLLLPSTSTIQDKATSNQSSQLLSAQKHLEQLIKSSIQQPHHHTRRYLSSSNYSALDVLFCHDEDSMKYFYWRKDWKWPHCPHYSPDGKHGSLSRKIVPGTQMTLVFVIFNDKVTAMKEFLRSMHENIQTSFQLVVLETASMIPEALDLVDWMREHGMPVIFTSPMFYAEYMDYLGHTINEYVSSHPEYSYYVVTDPDLSLKGIKGDIFTVFAQLLDIYPDIPAVGSALRIDDLDNSSYSMRISAVDDGSNIQKWESQFWPDTINGTRLPYSPLKVYHYPAYIDTTLMMCRRDFYWHRLNLGLRVMAPYEVRHVDWYYSPATGMPKEMVIYTCTKWAALITHARLDSCEEYYEQNKINASSYIVPSFGNMRPNYFIKERVKRVVGNPVINIYVGTMKIEERARRPGFWVDFNRQSPYLITESRITYNDLPIPYDQDGNITEVKHYSTNVIEDCTPFMLPVYQGYKASNLSKMFATNCKKIESKVGKENIYLYGAKSSMEESINKMAVYWHNCAGGIGLKAGKSLAIALSTVVKHLTMFHINEVEFAIQGYEMAFLRSIETYLPLIQKITLSCQDNFLLYRHDKKEDNNQCDNISSYLQKHGFHIDSKQVKNCILDEYEIKASKAQVAKHWKQIKHEHEATVALIVRMSLKDEHIFEHALKPSLDSFISRKHYQVIYLLDDSQDDHIFGERLQAERHDVVKYINSTTKDLTWIYALNNFTTADVIGVLFPSDILHTFLTNVDIMDSTNRLFVAAMEMSSKQIIDSLALKAVWDIEKVNISPRFLFRSTLINFKNFIQKKDQASDFESTITKLNGYHPLHVLFNFAAQHEIEQYKFISPKDSQGMVMVGSKSKSLANKYIRVGCCRSFASIGCESANKENHEHLVHFITSDEKPLDVSWAVNGSTVLVKEHYLAVKYHVKQMVHTQQKRMSSACRKFMINI